MICKGCGSLMDYIGIDDAGCNYADTFADLYRCPECGEEDCQDGAPMPEDDDHDYTDEEPGDCKCHCGCDNQTYGDMCADCRERGHGEFII